MRRTAHTAQNTAARAAARVRPQGGRLCLPRFPGTDQVAMPTDADMATFDTAQDVWPLFGAFAAMSGSYRFAGWRDKLVRGARDPGNADYELDADEVATLAAAITQEAHVSPAQLVARMEQYRLMYDPDAALDRCGECGRADFAFVLNTNGLPAPQYTRDVPLARLPELIAEPAVVAVWAAMPAAYRATRSLVEHDGYTYAVYTAMVRDTPDGPVTALCPACTRAHEKAEFSTYSARAGFDVGDVSSLHLPTPTIAELHALTHARALMSTVHLPAGGSSYATTRGHVITFAADAPAALATAGVLPSLSNARATLTVTLTGPEGADRKSAAIEAALGLGGVLHVNATTVIAWLRYLKAVHPDYANVVIDDSAETRAALEGLGAELVATAAFVPTSADDDREHAAQTDDVTKPAPPGAATAACASDPTYVQHVVVVPSALETPPEGNTLAAALSLVNHVAIARSGEPTNEITHNDDIINGAFPHLFPFKANLPHGGMPLTLRQQLLSMCDRRIPQCQQFVAFIANQVRRHDCARHVANVWKGDAPSMRKLAELLNADDIDERVAAARDEISMARPGDEGSGPLVTALVGQFDKFMGTLAGRQSYSQAERCVTRFRKYSTAGSHARQWHACIVCELRRWRDPVPTARRTLAEPQDRPLLTCVDVRRRGRCNRRGRVDRAAARRVRRMTTRRTGQDAAPQLMPRPAAALASSLR